DLIVSEWMGSMLLYESMLHSVINARDRFLSPNGIMLPAHCDMFIVPLDLTEYISEHVGFWDNVFDVKMSVLQEKARSEFFSTPVFTRTIKERELLSEEKIFYSFETKTVTEKDLDDILSVFDFEVEKDGDLHGFGCWFDVRFLKTVLSTNPKEPETHWKQTTLVFDEISKVRKGDKINGVISLSRSSLWGRHYEVIIKYWFGGNSNRHFQKKFPLS
ncbi:class I-like SAM-binding methyltransferase superfamily, partial [Bonamia ostreae]